MPGVRRQLFDSHFHIIDPRFPLVANQNYLPSAFTCADYLARAHPLNIVGGAIVSGSFQAFDQSYLLAALKELGPTFVGVTQLPATVSDEEIIHLNAAGVRAIRFNLKRGGSESTENLENFAHRVYELAHWHIELYVDANDLPALTPTLLKLPAVSIDHLGLSKSGFPSLLVLVEQGVRVKLSGFGRVDLNIPQALKELASLNPNALLFGTDLPSTRAPKPFTAEDIKLIMETLEPGLWDKVFYQNAIDCYRPNMFL